MKIRIAGTVNDSIVDGPGLRFTVFTQGCRHNCAGCHNPETHDAAGGQDADTDEIVKKFLTNPLLSGITLSGGDPMEQAEPCAVLAEEAHRHSLNVWTYTGYTLEQLLSENDAQRMRLLRATDVLVDGPFILTQRSLELKFCGSRNQRLIDMKKTLAANRVVLWTPPVW